MFLTLIEATATDGSDRWLVKNGRFPVENGLQSHGLHPE